MPSNVISSPIDLIPASSPEQLLSVDGLTEGYWAIRGVIRFSSSNPGNCLTLIFSCEPAPVAIAIHTEYQTRSLDRDIWTHANAVNDGYQLPNVDESSHVYMATFEGVISTASGTSEFKVEGVAATENGVITVLEAGYAEAVEQV